MKSNFLRSLSGLLSLSLLLAACANPPVNHDAGNAPAPVESADAVETGVAEEQKEPTSEDVMYRVFAGEVTGAEGDMKRAAGEYLEAAMESDDPLIAARATRIALAAEAWQHAAMAADRWAFLQPENIEARQTAARTMMVVGDYVGAEHQLNELIRQMPDENARAWALVAALLTSSGNLEKANRMMEHLVEDNAAQDNPDALIARSQFLARQGQLKEAAELAAQAISQQSDRAEFHAWAGRIAVNLEQDQAALNFYETAWKLQPQNNRIAMPFAELLKRNEQVIKALEVLAGLEDSPSTRLARIAFALDAGEQELAEEIYSGFATAEYVDPSDHAFQAAQSAELLGLPAEAAEWYAKVGGGERKLVAALRRAYLTAEAGDLGDARNQLAELRLQHDSAIVKESFLAESEILLGADQPALAYELLNGALDTLPGDTQLLYGRAMVAVELDHLEAAEQDLRQVIDQEPGNAAALNALGYTLADRVGRYEEAEALIRAAFELQPEEASIIDSMGWVAFRLGRLQEAETFLRDAWSRDNNAEIAAHLGEVLWTRELQDEAVKIWTEALQIDPANEVLIETMSRLGVSP
jgi:tetratricopeptide (TPR) repeat protein